MNKKPIILVTCKVGSEDWCIEEIGNVLYPYDNSVEVIKTKYRGLLIAYSKLSAYEAYKLLLTREYGFVRNIIPIMITVPFDENLLYNKVKEVVKNTNCVKIKLRIRGVRGYSQKIWMGLVNAIRESGSKHDPNCNTCLFIEVIDSDVYIGLREC
ncbi:MAG: hypothetical protein QW170_00975 [Desulfurococcaceae archaeon]|uniref:Uncharacterized protein n=1 Tax=Staphylothermus marinus TaxID=2280 RepID=A0A7C4JLJ1_STAMA